LDVVSAEEHCRVQNLHNKKEILNCSIIVYSTYVKSQGRRAGVPDHQILIKFKNHVAQLQKVEKKLKQQTQNTNNFCDFVVSEFQKNLHNNEAFISILVIGKFTSVGRWFVAHLGEVLNCWNKFQNVRLNRFVNKLMHIAY
jgi:hypothetical protein